MADMYTYREAVQEHLDKLLKYKEHLDCAIEDNQKKIIEAKKKLDNVDKLINITKSDISKHWNSLNSEEGFIFNIIKDCINDKLEIWPQVSCSAIFNNKGDKELWYSYNKLYVDFLILEKEIKFKSGDASYHVPKCIIEYDGKGHDRTDDGFFRDMIKNFLAEKANIPLVRLEEFDENKESRENYADRVQKEIKNALYKN